MTSPALSLLVVALAAGPSAPADVEAVTLAAEAAVRAGDYRGAATQYRQLVDDLESRPPATEPAGAWASTLLRLAVVEATLGNAEASREAMERLLAIEPTIQADPELFSPSIRKELEAARARVAARPRYRLGLDTVDGTGRAWVGGRAVSPLPAAVELPVGTYRAGAEVGGRVHTVTVELAGDQAVVLDRPVSGLASVPPSPTPVASSSASWMAPTAWAAGGLALVAAGLATWQGIAAGNTYSEAMGMLLPDGTLKPGVDPAAYASISSTYDAERRNAWIAGGSAVLLGAGAVVLWILAPTAPVAPSPGGLAVRF